MDGWMDRVSVEQKTKINKKKKKTTTMKEKHKKNELEFFFQLNLKLAQHTVSFKHPHRMHNDKQRRKMKREIEVRI